MTELFKCEKSKTTCCSPKSAIKEEKIRQDRIKFQLRRKQDTNINNIEYQVGFQVSVGLIYLGEICTYVHCSQKVFPLLPLELYGRGRSSYFQKKDVFSFALGS